MSQSAKLILPKIKKVRLSRFSLFSLQPNIDIDISGGVFCLAGANGLGKSTFLSALNFAITGIVPDPSRGFMSVDEYYKYCIGYSDDYFTGKISEDDREAAAVDVHLQVGDFLYQLSRGVFEPQELREFVILRCSSGESVLDGKDLTPAQRHLEYEKRIAADTGLASFQQFVFLQHFLLTFDERRHLLLWDQNVLNQALFLAIGTDFEKAQKADSLRRERDRAASLARNYSWQASAIRSEIELLRNAMKVSDSDVDLEAVKTRHQALIEEVVHKQKDVEQKKGQLDDAELKRMQVSSLLTSLEAEYATEFSRQVNKRSRVVMHPLIKTSIFEQTCSLCGSHEPHVAKSIQTKIDENICPLCNSAIPGESVGQDFMKALRDIDKRIAEARKQLDSANKSKDRITLELQSTEAELEGMRASLRQYESANERALMQLLSPGGGINLAVEKKTDEMQEHLKRKDEQYTKRDDKQKELLKLYHELSQRYMEAEKDFVPLFRRLASLFIGIDLDMRMDYSTSVTSLGLSFTIEMQGSVRRQRHQLSESQRFFLDIALRMALAQYMSAPQGKACLFIDTPEGSLDIAYESRAGQMFAAFVETGHDIIMTANINTSQILQRMATLCGESKMTLHRMTSWAPLSEVQLKEEQLFEQAYSVIETSLKTGGSSSSG